MAKSVLVHFLKPVNSLFFALSLTLLSCQGGSTDNAQTIEPYTVLQDSFVSDSVVLIQGSGLIQFLQPLSSVNLTTQFSIQTELLGQNSRIDLILMTQDVAGLGGLELSLTRNGGLVRFEVNNRLSIPETVDLSIYSISVDATENFEMDVKLELVGTTPFLRIYWNGSSTPAYDSLVDLPLPPQVVTSGLRWGLRFQNSKLTRATTL